MDDWIGAAIPGVPSTGLSGRKPHMQNRVIRVTWRGLSGRRQVTINPGNLGRRIAAFCRAGMYEQSARDAVPGCPWGLAVGRIA
jgi:hypothetical protein